MSQHSITITASGGWDGFSAKGLLSRLNKCDEHNEWVERLVGVGFRRRDAQKILRIQNDEAKLKDFMEKAFKRRTKFRKN